MTIPYFAEADVRAALGVPAVIESVEMVLRHEAEGTAWNIDKTMATWPEKSSAHSLGAVDLADGVTIFKNWVNTPQGASALLTIFSAADGALQATAQAGIAGALRTGALAGVATRWMSAPDADEMALLGSGRQALTQVAAVTAVRPIRRIHLWSRSPENREAFAETLRSQFDIEVVTADSVSEATRDVPVVTLITRASEPFIGLADLAEGAHLNAVGAILPANAEFESDILGAASLVAVDSIANAQAGSRELREHFGPDGDWSTIARLADVVTGKVRRPDSPRCTVFKAMGMGLSDLAVARLLIGGLK